MRVLRVLCHGHPNMDIDRRELGRDPVAPRDGESLGGNDVRDDLEGLTDDGDKLDQVGPDFNRHEDNGHREDGEAHCELEEADDLDFGPADEALEEVDVDLGDLEPNRRFRVEVEEGPVEQEHAVHKEKNEPRSDGNESVVGTSLDERSDGGGREWGCSRRLK